MVAPENARAFYNESRPMPRDGACAAALTVPGTSSIIPPLLEKELLGV